MDTAELSTKLSQSNLAFASAAAEFLKSADDITFSDPSPIGDLEAVYRIRLILLKDRLARKNANPSLRETFHATAEFLINLRKEKPSKCSWAYMQVSNKPRMYAVVTNPDSGTLMACIPGIDRRIQPD